MTGTRESLSRIYSYILGGELLILAMPNQSVSLARDVYALPSGPLSVSSSRECSKETTRLEGENAFSSTGQPGYIAWTSETPGRGVHIAAQSFKFLRAQTWQPDITSPFPLTGLGTSPKDITSLFWGKVCLCSLDWSQIYHSDVWPILCEAGSHSAAQAFH